MIPMTLLALLATTAATPVAASSAPLPSRVEQAIHARIDAGDYPALVVAVVDGGNSAVHAFGKLDDGNAPDADTVFEIGSITKTFTATLLADAVASGRLQLDAPVASLLPGFTLPSRDGKSITLENLATQHSGLPRLPSDLAPANPGDPYADYDAGRLKAFLADYALTRDPGSAYEYSNLGFGLLGYALAQHAGSSYAALLEKRVFGPLGMRSSSTQLDDAMRSHLATGHDETGKAVGNWSFAALAGCGAIKSTATDMLRYLEANMGTLKSPLAAAIRLAHAPRADVPGADERIGLAWMTRHTADGDVVWHNGMTGGYASFIGFRADGSRGVVILANAQQSVDDLGFAILIADAPLAPTQARIAMNAQQLDAYTGSYRLAPGVVLKVFRDNDQLYAQATGQGAFPVFPSAADEFFAKVAGIRLSFQRDSGGKVASLVLHQNGHDSPAPRLGDAEVGAKVVQLDAKILAAYVGQYRLAPQLVFTVTLENGQLMAQLTGQPAFPVYASARDRFFYKVVDAQLDFERDADGRVTALVLHQNGAEQRARRTSSTAVPGS
jgi:CubicO group peptidase (beta-lactamase class C family)